MKKLITLIVAVCIAGSTTLSAQSALKLIKERVGNPEILKNWDIGEMKSLSNADVLRVNGSNDIDHRTNLFYTANGSYLKEAPGGQLMLFFDRLGEDLADPALFTVTVIDSDGNEIYQKCLENEEQPYYYKWDIWYCFETINIPTLVTKTFTVKIEDEGLNENFEFTVSIRQETEFMPQQLLSLTQEALY